MMMIHWPQVIVATIVLYALILVSLPFSTVYATMFLFALVGYWSRIPGVGIPSPFFILYYMDLVDLFSVIVAINVGPLEGFFFTMFCNLGSRLAGVTPKWWGVIRDSSFQGIICLAMPLLQAFVGSDVFVIMMVYTIIRRILFIVVYLFYQDIPIPNFIILWPGVTAGSLLINAFYAKYFGYYFDGLLQAGIQFNWPMFIIVTIIIFTAKTTLFGRVGSKWLDQRYLLKRIFTKLTAKKDKTLDKKTDEDFLREVKRII